MEYERKPSSPNIKPIDLNLLKSLKENKYILDRSPFWWGLDYLPDEHEYMSYYEFENRLVEIKPKKFSEPSVGNSFGYGEEPFFVYPEGKVPITTLNLDVMGQKLSFMVTARPFNPKEIGSYDYLLNIFQTTERLKKLLEIDVKNEKDLNRPKDEFLPHIRGLIVSQRKGNIFWYPILDETEFQQSVSDSLKQLDLDYLGINFTSSQGYKRTYPLVAKELRQHPDLFNTKRLDLSKFFPTKEVSAEEFVRHHRPDLSLIYPVKIPGINLEIPFYISNHSIDSNHCLFPTATVYGAYLPDVFPVKDCEIAKKIVEQVSLELNIPTDVLVRIPQKGHPEIKRVSLSDLSI